MTGHALDFGDGLIYGDMDYLHAHLRAPIPTLRRWAHEDGWARRKVHGRSYYLVKHAQQSRSDRHRTTRPRRHA